MSTRSLLVLAFSFALSLSACSPFTIASSSGEQLTPEVANMPVAESQTQLNPVHVEHVEVQVGVGSPIPVEIVASGSWSDLCAQIAEVKSQINEFQIEVTVLASTTESCLPGNQGLPFRLALPLNFADRPEGTYTITVNGTSTTLEWPPKADPGTGSISGWVWHDDCVTALDGEPALTSAPPGCIQHDSQIGPYHADGVLNPNELPIESLIVKLREGDCTATSLADVREQVMTIASDLSYTFAGLRAGTYCVSIDQQAEPNFTVLGPGVWTYPYVAHNIIAQTISLASDEDRHDVNFGWDFQFK